jgi:hypothetical protein
MDLADLITLPSGKPYRRARRHQSPPPPNSHLISSLVLLFLIFYLSLTSSSFRLKKKSFVSNLANLQRRSLCFLCLIPPCYF